MLIFNAVSIYYYEGILANMLKYEIKLQQSPTTLSAERGRNGKEMDGGYDIGS